MDGAELVAREQIRTVTRLRFGTPAAIHGVSMHSLRRF